MRRELDKFADGCIRVEHLACNPKGGKLPQYDYDLEHEKLLSTQAIGFEWLLAATSFLLLFFFGFIAINIWTEDPHARVMFQVADPQLKPQTKPQETKNHFVSSSHLAHYKYCWWNDE
jgi:hypothetical protein